MPSGIPGDFSVGGNGLGSSGNFGQYTSDAATDVITIITGNTPANGQQVVFDPAGVPSGLTAGTTYYAVNVSLNTFQVATTPGGTPIDIGTGGGNLTLGAMRVESLEGDIFVGGLLGYLEKLSTLGEHLAWLECRDTPVTGNLCKVLGVTVGPDGEPYSALEPLTGGPYDYQPHDISYDIANDRLVVILARTNDTALIRILNLDADTVIAEFTGIDLDTGWTHETPLKIVVDCAGEVAYYTDMGRTIFRYDLTGAGAQLTPYWELPVDDPNCFGDLDIRSNDQIIVDMTITGHGPRRACGLGSDEFVWADRINPPDGIHRIYKIRTDDHSDVLASVVALDPNGGNGEITTVAAYYLKCDEEPADEYHVVVTLIGAN